MRKSKFNKPPSFCRNMTKADFKHIWQVWRVLDVYERINILTLFDGYICWGVDANRDVLDPLLIKSVSLAISIEQSQLKAA